MEELCTKDNQTLGSIRNLRLKITPNKTVINKNVSSIKTRNMSLPYIETAKSSNRLHTKHSIFPSRVATPHITNVYIARSRYPLKVCLIHIIMCAFFLYVRVEIWFAMPHSENPYNPCSNNTPAANGLPISHAILLFHIIWLLLWWTHTNLEAIAHKHYI